MIVFNENEFLTPPQVAKRLRVSCEKVIGWLLAGELRGCDLASKDSRRPRYRISESDLAEFLKRRSASVPPAAFRMESKVSKDEGDQP